MKTIALLFFIAILPLFSSFGQESSIDSFVLISGEKVSLRYSTRNDVEKIIGTPEKTVFYERGGEGFYWRNFTVCSYDNDRLSINYDQNGAVIRIIVNGEYSGDVHFLRKNIKNLSRRDIMNVMNNFEKEEVYFYSTDGIIMFGYRLTPSVLIEYGFWFFDNGKDWYTETVNWIDMYYPISW